MYLLDTNVISALRRPDCHPAPTSWLKDQRASDVYISVVTFGEIERGIAQQIPRNPDFARDLAQWFERTLALFADRAPTGGCRHGETLGPPFRRPRS